MKKLNNHLKGYIKRSIYETGINDLKYFVELYGIELMNRVHNIIEFLRLKKGLIIKILYANCTKVYSNYYKYNKDHFKKYGYILKNGFYCKYDLVTIA